MSGVVLDTAVLIAAERGVFDLPSYLASLGETPVALAAISASELLHGVERARDAVVRQRRSAYVEGVLANVPVIPFGLAEARAHARIWAALVTAGTLIGAHDMQVAATALVAGGTVATLNDAEFRRVPDLRLAALTPFMRAVP